MVFHFLLFSVLTLWGGSIGNYHFVWKIPTHIDADVLFGEDQKAIEQIKFLVSQEIFSSGTIVVLHYQGKKVVVREIFKWITGKI